ncbi:MAG TPA: bifunctional demethylmenaquinone methyltransferase/2-methoxy-6-polyprenyl-1,4-benzoquinol methylase UbiE [Bryobacteraceae bacterium]|nr:bifunctional demethylmenaquinone methyltransferase/2-methoxy-6-polyprenyl-1,4-benzoquinol methylase UbiE [Bryobacteraceae bacterium]
MPDATATTGTTPRGVAGEQAAARWVCQMFGRVAPRYDLLNHLLSFNLDKRWRALLIARVAPLLARPGARVLDLCCGTGDVLLAMWQRSAPNASLMGADFSHPMLVEAKRKIAARNFHRPVLEADALMLPLGSASLDLVTIAFGFRNLANYQAGLQELLRVLKPGGLAAILEFSQPTRPVIAGPYRFFSRFLLPRIGGLISGVPEAYSYLPESIQKFPGAEDLARQMRQAGFSSVGFERLTGGIVALHVAAK